MEEARTCVTNGLGSRCPGETVKTFTARPRHSVGWKVPSFSRNSKLEQRKQ